MGSLPSVRRTTETQRHRGQPVRDLRICNLQIVDLQIRRCLSLCLCVSVVCLGWLSLASGQQLLDRVVARVNNVPITLTDVDAALGLGIVTVTGAEEPRAAAARQLIERQLMLAEVARFAPPEPDAAAIAGEMAEMQKRAGARLEALMQSTGLDEQRLREIARETLRIQAYLNQRFGATVQVSVEEVEQYYRAHPAEFTRNGQLMSFDDAEAIARERASALRRAALVAQWLRDIRARADVVENRAQ
jgi:hypothetical protein